ncbi:MAG: DUF1223 domain-containing protein [Hyphomicrobiales bacterium]|nr:DUF1223 domain-containing protein [Hyphomicrobiales bacterium]
MKTSQCLFFGLALIAGLGFAGPAQSGPKAVVELFTSQGCSSCPPADAFLGELKARDDLIVLSLPVDYWDYLGWKDTFGKPEHSERQYAYSRARGDRRVYTPQIIVNGGDHYVGSHRSAVKKAIGETELPLEVLIKLEDGSINITIAGADLRVGHTTIRLVTYTSAAEVAIGRGENRGHTITYNNIVRSMRPIGMWKGEAMTVSLPRDEILGEDIDGCAVIVQEDAEGGPGRILGAAAWMQSGS